MDGAVGIVGVGGNLAVVVFDVIHALVVIIAIINGFIVIENNGADIAINRVVLGLDGPGFGQGFVGGGFFGDAAHVVVTILFDTVFAVYLSYLNTYLSSLFASNSGNSKSRFSIYSSGSIVSAFVLTIRWTL